MAYEEAREAWIVGAVRTPMGRHGGQLSSVRPDDLAAEAVSALVERAGVPAEEIEDVYLGCANQAGEDNRNVARMASILAGLPEEVAGATVNRLCGSGLEAVSQAARAVMLGEANAYIGGGVESMSRAPWVMPKPERAFAAGHRTVYDTTLGWRMTNPKMEKMGHTDSLGMTAENLAESRYAVTTGEGEPEKLAAEYDISRERQDKFALHSHNKAVAAQRAGRFDEELVPVTVKGRKEDTVFDSDEGPRADTSLEKMASLQPLAPNGRITAAVASQISDGASALLIASERAVKEHNLKPRARIHHLSVRGDDPIMMLTAPIPATRHALKKTGMKITDFDHIEINEAFASVVLAWAKELQPDMSKVNPNGGAIALGHPLGATGTKLMATMLNELERTGGRWGLQTMCEGGGQANVTIIERL